MAEQLTGRLIPTMGFRGISGLFRQPAASTQVWYFDVLDSRKDIRLTARGYLRTWISSNFMK